MNLKAYAVLGIIFFIIYIVAAFDIIKGIPVWVQHFSVFVTNLLGLIKIMQERNKKELQ